VPSQRVSASQANPRLSFGTCRFSLPTSSATVNSLEGPATPAFIMADDIVIDKQLFHERLSGLVSKWKADKRSGDHIFQGAGSMAAVVGKPSEPGSYLKPAAFQVSATAQMAMGRR
jgi:hypothetical protein